MDSNYPLENISVCRPIELDFITFTNQQEFSPLSLPPIFEPIYQSTSRLLVSELIRPHVVDFCKIPLRTHSFDASDLQIGGEASNKGIREPEQIAALLQWKLLYTLNPNLVQFCSIKPIQRSLDHLNLPPLISSFHSAVLSSGMKLSNQIAR